MSKSLVYSYTRFSDPRQANGSSAERQAEYSKKWAAERGMTLDDTLSLKDEGLSAYHQRHIKQGALGTFLAAVSDGLIPTGSVLIVEGLDRLSRAEPIQAQAQLAQIVNAGITVVTASDGREYNRERLKAQPMDLVYSLLVMIRAHEESATKSTRVKAAIRRQCEGWVTGSYRGIIRNGKDPQWLKWNGSGWDLVLDRVEAIKLAIDLFKQGHGSVRIVRELTERGMAMTSSGNLSTHIYKAFRLRALIGDRDLEVDGQEYCLTGYYPAIISPAEYAELQLLLNNRRQRKGKGEIPGIVTGLNITYCGYCGTAAVGQNLMSRKRQENGRPQNGHRRLLCVAYSHNSGCPIGGSCSVVPVENAVMRYCSDQMNLTSLISGDDGTGTIAAGLSASRQRAAEYERQLARITDAMLSDTEAMPAAFVKKARELEIRLSDEQAAIDKAQLELSAAGRRSTPASSDAWSAVLEGAIALDYDARMQARKLVSDTFSRIVVYHRGTQPTAREGKYIDLLLIAKHGNTRLLRIHRTTGKWKAMEDYSAVAAA